MNKISRLETLVLFGKNIFNVEQCWWKRTSSFLIANFLAYDTVYLRDVSKTIMSILTP
jgi:hypothetical protein